LLSLDQLRDPSLVKEVDTYLATGPARERADKSQITQGEALVNRRFRLGGKLYWSWSTHRCRTLTKRIATMRRLRP